MQAQPNSGDFYTFAELQGLKKGDLVIFAHGYLNSRVSHLQPEFVWAFMHANRFDVWFRNIAKVQADGMIIKNSQIKLSESDYRSTFAKSARPPTKAEYRLAMRDRENIRVGAIEGYMKRLIDPEISSRITEFDDLAPEREIQAKLEQAWLKNIANYKRQRRLAMRRLRYRIRQTEEYPS